MDPKDPYRDLTSSQEWLRDRINWLLNAGYLAVIGMAGWFTSEGEKADIAACFCGGQGQKPCHVAILLLVVGSVLAVGWLREIYRLQDLIGAVSHATIRPRRSVLLRSWIIAGIIGAIMLAVVF